MPQPPGGGFDFVGRTLAEQLAKGLGQGIVVENRPGSGTLVGTDTAAKSAPDGHTLLVGSVSNMVLNSGLYPSLPYDPETVDAFEVGLKSEFWDNRVSLNIAAFYTKYKDIQQSTTVSTPGGTGNETIVTNAASAVRASQRRK
mgnify:CR=1 FL=1